MPKRKRQAYHEGEEEGEIVRVYTENVVRPVIRPRAPWEVSTLNLRVLARLT